MESFILESIGFIVGFVVAGAPLLLLFGGFLYLLGTGLIELINSLFGK